MEQEMKFKAVKSSSTWIQVDGMVGRRSKLQSKATSYLQIFNQRVPLLPLSRSSSAASSGYMGGGCAGLLLS